MRKLLKPVISSCLGTLIAFFLILIGGYFTFSIMIAQSKKPPKINPNTVLRLSLNNEIPEKTNNVQLTNFNWNNENVLGLQDLLKVLDEAKLDPNIRGIFLDADAVDLGLAGIKSLRQKLIDFRLGGKFILAHSNFYSQRAYYLATSADSVFLNPSGMIDLKGFAAQIPYYKNMLDKFGVEMEVFYAGKYKSATEPYRREDMSDENRFQIREYMNEIFDRFISDISESRKIHKTELLKLIDRWDSSSDRLCERSGLVDRIAYQDEVVDIMRKKLGLGKKSSVKTISPQKYFLTISADKKRKVKDKIAVIYVEGGFVGGKETGGVVAEREYVSMIRRLRKDKFMKAIVLRINSGGGSTMTSENIWRELQLAKSDDDISIVVSMGDVAASAAYMISVVADSIFAEENTLTGSIGVFGMMPTAQKLLNEKIGVVYDTVLTRPLSAGFSYFHSFSDKEIRVMQSRVDEAYSAFIEKVASGRMKTAEEIYEIAQGRIWTGTKAVDIGLVDRICSFEDAIRSASKLAQIDDYKIYEYPKVGNPFERWIGQIRDPQANMKQKALLKSQLGDYYPYYEFLYQVINSQGPQARLPFFIAFD